MARGRLIVLEGVDGSGKSTQARALAAALKARGLEVVLTGEPTDGPVGRSLKEYLKGPGLRLSPQEELDLFLADRRQHVEEVINPALAAGKVVISDRYYYSSVAYQGARGLDPERILAANEAFAPRPDLAIILSLPVAAALQRLTKRRARSRQVTEDLAYLERVAAIYATLTGPRLLVVDASLPPEETQAVILRQVLACLGSNKGHNNHEAAAGRRRAP
jgi:dTMP kinase